jgi:FkbM family methyltransferase
MPTTDETLQWIVETLKTINGNIVHLDAHLTALESGLTKKLLEAQCPQSFAPPTLPAPEPKAGAPRFIVTLTSHGQRIAATAPDAIYSIFQQSVLPDRIILWLAHDATIPPRLRTLQERGLEIRFCDDIGPYSRLIPALREFPDDVLVTADDGIEYPQDWFATLKTAWLREPDKIWCHLAATVTDDSHTLLPVQEWGKDSGHSTTPQGRLIPLNAGGVLYPPGALSELVTDTQQFMALAPHHDDFWYWMMARVKGTQAAVLSRAVESCPRLPDVLSTPDADSEFMAVLGGFPHVIGWLEPAHIRMKLDLHDFVQRLLFFNACVDNDELGTLLAVFPQGGVLVDLGAHVGLYALNFAATASRVFAVEATQATHDILAETIRNNGIENIRLYFNAIDREDGREIAIYPGPLGADNACANSVYRGAADDVPFNTVTTITLDSIVTENRIERIDLIKIDVEGAELNALLGGEKSIFNFRPFILCEFNSASSARAGSSTTELFNFIVEHLHYSPLRIDKGQFVPVTNFVEPHGEVINLMFIPTEKMALLQGS